MVQRPPPRPYEESANASLRNNQDLGDVRGEHQENNDQSFQRTPLSGYPLTYSDHLLLSNHNELAFIEDGDLYPRNDFTDQSNPRIDHEGQTGMSLSDVIARSQRSLNDYEVRHYREMEDGKYPEAAETLRKFIALWHDLSKFSPRHHFPPVEQLRYTAALAKVLLHFRTMDDEEEWVPSLKTDRSWRGNTEESHDAYAEFLIYMGLVYMRSSKAERLQQAREFLEGAAKFLLEMGDTSSQRLHFALQDLADICDRLDDHGSLDMLLIRLKNKNGHALAEKIKRRRITSANAWCSFNMFTVKRFNQLDTSRSCKPVKKAVEDGDVDQAETMLEVIQRTSPPDHMDNLVVTLMDVAARTQRLRMVKLILSFHPGFDKEIEDGSKTVLHRCQNKTGGTQVAALLLEKCPHLIDVRDENGRTAIFLAVDNQNETMVRLLLARNADPNIADCHTKTPLWLAAERGDEDIMTVLLDHNAKVNLPGPSGATALAVAVTKAALNMKYRSVVKLLMQYDADPSIKDREGRTAFARAQFKPHLKLLLEKASSRSSIDSSFSASTAGQKMTGTLPDPLESTDRQPSHVHKSDNYPRSHGGMPLFSSSSSMSRLSHGSMDKSNPTSIFSNVESTSTGRTTISSGHSIHGLSMRFRAPKKSEQDETPSVPFPQLPQRPQHPQLPETPVEDHGHGLGARRREVSLDDSKSTSGKLPYANVHDLAPLPEERSSCGSDRPTTVVPTPKLDTLTSLTTLSKHYDSGVAVDTTNTDMSEVDLAASTRFGTPLVLEMIADMKTMQQEAQKVDPGPNTVSGYASGSTNTQYSGVSGADAFESPSGKPYNFSGFDNFAIGSKAPIGDGNGDEEDEDQDHNHDHGSVPDVTGPLFACPFFKLDPVRYYACRNKSFREPARIKQHIKRAHQNPPQCTRCGQTFSHRRRNGEIQFNENNVLLGAHLRADPPCALTTVEPLDGLNRDQYHLLTRRAVRGTREEQWRQIFCLISPGNQRNPLPSPYVEPQASRLGDRMYNFVRHEAEMASRQFLETQGYSGNTLDHILLAMNVVHQRLVGIFLTEAGEAPQAGDIIGEGGESVESDDDMDTA